MDTNKRTSKRRSMAMDLMLDSVQSGRHTAHTRDISLDGMQLETDAPPKAGEAVTLVFWHDRTASMHRWHANVVRASGKHVAVHFDALAPDELPTLVALLRDTYRPHRHPAPSGLPARRRYMGEAQ